MDKIRTTKFLLILKLLLYSSAPLADCLKHLLHRDSCGGSDMCDSNKGLHCDIESNVCECSPSANWILDFENFYACRVPEGGKCAIGTGYAERCERAMDCVPVKDNVTNNAETVCMCTSDKVMGCPSRGVFNSAPHSTQFSANLLIVLAQLLIIYRVFLKLI